MAKFTVVTMPGDGIGNQVLPSALRLLTAVGFDAECVDADIGWDCWCNEGNALPQRTIELLAGHKLGLFGAITSKPKKEADAELKPSLRGKGYTYYSPIVTMRQRRLQFSIGFLLRLGEIGKHTSELQSLRHLVCRLLLEKKKKKTLL